MKVKAEMTLLSHQLEFANSEAKYPALVGGLGSGKTEAGIYRIFKLMAKNGKAFKATHRKYVVGIYEPTYDLIKLILYPRFEEILTNFNIEFNLNKTDKFLDIPAFNTMIIFRSMENEERIIGYEHADFWMDELDTLPADKAERVFNKVVSRNRLAKPAKNKSKWEIANTGCITTTPEGFKFVYSTWIDKAKKELEQNGHTDYQIIKGKTHNNPFLPDGYADDLISKYPANLIEAYLNGEFVNMAAGNVYSNFDEEESIYNMTLERFFKNPMNDKEIHIGMDFNVGHMSGVVAVNNKIDDELLVVEEIFDLLDTPDMIKEINKRYSGYAIHIYPDASGSNRKTVSASQSDISLLAEAGFYVIYGKKNPPVKDRVLAVNSMLENGRGLRRLFVNDKSCPNLIDNLKKQAYDPKTGAPDKKSGNDHMLDALGYMVNSIYPIHRQLFIKE